MLFHDLQDKTLIRLGVGVEDRRECNIVDYSLQFMVVINGWEGRGKRRRTQ